MVSSKMNGDMVKFVKTMKDIRDSIFDMYYAFKLFVFLSHNPRKSICRVVGIPGILKKRRTKSAKNAVKIPYSPLQANCKTNRKLIKLKQKNIESDYVSYENCNISQDT